MGWWLDFSKAQLTQPTAYLWFGLNPFFGVCLSKKNNFALDENMVLWPKTNCPDVWVAEFSENIELSDQTIVWFWSNAYFGAYLSM